MSDLDDILHDLVVANRILAHQGEIPGLKKASW